MNTSSTTVSAVAAVAIALSIALCTTGCATERQAQEHINPGTTDLVVRDLEFEGVENVSERALRQGLATRESPARIRVRLGRLPLIGADAEFYNRFSWLQDRERILAFYRQQGYFHAAVVSESIIEDPEAQTVRIRVTIDEGEPTRVDQIDIQGLVEDVTPDREELLQGLPLRENHIFTQRDYRQTRMALQDRLRAAGHAYATVNGQVYVDINTKTADVEFFAEPGPVTRIGEIHIVGLDEIDEQAVRRAIRLRQGDNYSPQQLRRTQEDVFDLGVFGMVTVLPAHEARERIVEDPDEREQMDEILDDYDVPDDLSEPGTGTDVPIDTEDATVTGGVSSLLHSAQSHAESRSRLEPEVPIVVRVQEATGYNVRIGAGLAAESTRQDVRGLLNWSSRNFLGGLRRLEHFNAAGYAWSPGLIGPGDLRNRGVILSSELRFQQPQFLESRTNLRLRGRVSRDVREGFSVWNPSFRLSVDRALRDHFLVDLSYNVAYFNYFNVEEGLLDPVATELGLDFQTEFLLEHFEQTIAYDRRDDILDPKSGFRVDLSVQQAGRFLVGGEFDFIKPILSGEVYYGLGDASVLALRSRLGSVYNVRRDTDIPIQSRLYSGGTDSMRSFGRRRLSLYTPTGDDAVPVGGLSQFEASVEPRFRLISNLADVGDLWGALFFDSATVMGGQLLVDTRPNIHGTTDVRDIQQSLMHGVGIGMWWNTPVGPVRLDYAYTLTNITEDLRFRRCENPEDYSTPNCVFVPLEEDPIQESILGYGLYLSIGHSF